MASSETETVQRPASQLFLPFTEGQSKVAVLEQPSPGPLPPSVEPPPPAPGDPSPHVTTPCSLNHVRRYLARHFEDFVLQQRQQPIGMHITLYRVPDGTLFRINVSHRFLAEDRTEEEMERFLDEHDLQGKMPASVLSAILIDVDGIHVPTMTPPAEEAPENQRSGFGRVLLDRLKEATGFSFLW